MADKYLEVNATGDPQEREVITSSAGAADAGKLIGLDSSGLIHPSFLHDVPETTYVAFEDLAAGDFISVIDDGGVAKVRRADASAYSSGFLADGFVQTAYTTGQTATVVTGEEFNVGVTGLTPGTRYYLSDTVPGGVTATPPTDPGTFIQRLGVARLATELQVSISPTVIVRS